MPAYSIIGERRRSPLGSVYEATGVGPSPSPVDSRRQGVFVDHVGGPNTGVAVSAGWVSSDGWATWPLVGAPAVPEPPAPDWEAVALKFRHATEAIRGCEINLPIQVASLVLDAESAYKAARAT